MKLSVLLGALSILLLVLPRSPLTYPLYLLASILIINFAGADRKSYWLLLAGATALCAGFAFNLGIFDVSPTGFLLQFALLTPFLMFLAGFRARFEQQHAVLFIRVLNVLVVILSLLFMAIEYGFPLKLPYVDFLPDAYSALYEKGGAKIVTVIGLFGLLVELFIHQPHNRFRLAFIFCAIANFIVPSYVIGIICGLVAIVLVSFSLRGLMIGMIGVIGIAVVTATRWQALADTWFGDWGIPPKLYGFLIVWDYLTSEPVLLLTGTGLGQFSNEAAIWASDLFSETTRSINLPGFFMSEHHYYAFRSVSAIWRYDFWAISSSANKPYSTVSSMIAETGIPLMFGLCLLYWLRLQPAKPALRKFARSLMFAGIALMLVDSWADQPWFSYLLLLCTPFLAGSDSTASQSRAKGVKKVEQQKVTHAAGLEERNRCCSVFAEELKLDAPLRVDINTASITELSQHLRGIGPARATAIVLHRQENGVFQSIDALKQVKGITDLIIERNRDRLWLSQPLFPDQERGSE